MRRATVAHDLSTHTTVMFSNRPSELDSALTARFSKSVWHPHVSNKRFGRLIINSIVVVVVVVDVVVVAKYCRVISKQRFLCCNIERWFPDGFKHWIVQLAASNV
jgi:hypothetical protein